MKRSKLVIDQDGFASGIYDDDDVDLYDALGAVTISRASHVEPSRGGWSAIMRDGCECGHSVAAHLEVERGYAPCSAVGCSCDDFNCAVLGPYRLRSEALAAEVEYLDRALFGLAAAANKRGV